MLFNWFEGQSKLSHGFTLLSSFFLFDHWPAKMSSTSCSLSLKKVLLFALHAEAKELKNGRERKRSLFSCKKGQCRIMIRVDRAETRASCVALSKNDIVSFELDLLVFFGAAIKKTLSWEGWGLFPFRVLNSRVCQVASFWPSLQYQHIIILSERAFHDLNISIARAIARASWRLHCFNVVPVSYTHLTLPTIA